MSNTEIEQVVPSEQKTVYFLDDELVAIRGNDNQIYVSINHLADALGLDRRGQLQRINRQKVLMNGFREGRIMTAGGPQISRLLRVDLVPLFLSGVNTKRVKEEVRDKIEQYQTDAAKILWDAFQVGELSADFQLTDLLEADTPAVQTYKMMVAITKMARQQVLHEAQINQNRAQIEDNALRIEMIEAALGNQDRLITTTQASRISQAVKAIGLELGKRSGRNEFGGVYGELYRRFEIAGYRELPATRYDEAFNFLSDWYSSITNTDLPF